MKNVLIISSCLIFLLIGCSSSKDATYKNIQEPGAKVFILMNNGTEYEGELLRVRDSVMILCERFNVREKDLADSAFAIYILNNHYIRLIELIGKSNAIYGIIFGCVMGAAIGAAVYKSKDKEEEKPEGSFSISFDINTDPITGCCIGGIFGAMIGGIIGFSITDDEVVYDYANPEEYDFTQLNIYSRYGGKEPEYLEQIK